MLDEMKEAGRSKHSGTVVKKKSSSGCLYIKKKGADSAGGVSGFSESSSSYLSKPRKAKKRCRVVESDSEYSDNSSETIRQKVDKFHNGSAVYKGDYSENREFQKEKRASNGLDVFEFDEYDGFDDSRIRKAANNGRHKWKLYKQSAGNSASRPTYDATSRFEMEDDEYDLPLSVFSEKHRLSSNQAVRQQGKSGVLKVMVNKNKRSRKSYDKKEPKPRVVHKKKLDKIGDHRDAGDGQSSRTEDTKSKEKVELKFQEPMVAKSSKEINESDTVTKLKLYTRRKAVKNKAVKTPDHVNRVKGKVSTVKHGSITERQILREKIKNMLLDAGWTIKYIPRKDKNYLDANYINPAGTVYWSIIKAYDVLQQEEKDNIKDGGKFTPLRDEILDKLARLPQKKIKREMKNKRKDKGSSKNAKRAMEDTVSDEEDGRKSRKLSRCTLLVRDSNKLPKSENDEFSLYLGKRTLLAWLIDSGVVHMSEDVEYMNPRRTRALQKGKITRDGIRCGCCSKVVTVLKFELHSRSKARNPYKNILLKSGKSLMQCQIDAWNTLGDSERKGFFIVDVDGDDPNDDTCGLCGDGGDLICCDSCPSTFHQTCLDIQMLPQGDWHCPNCSCKYCEMPGGGKTEASLLMCCLCCKKYHESCRPEIDVKPNESTYLNLSFCGQKCHEVYSELQKLVGVKHELDSGFSWSLIHRSDSSRDASSEEISQRVECNSMLAVAMSVMDECFLPVTDSRLGINLIRNVVFNCGSNLSRLNYSGFYTAILERGDEVVSAASIRFHGTQLAEMPYIGTRHIYRRQGMCRRLLSAIESALSVLDVDKLIIPAVAEHMNTWTDVFGFLPLEESHKQEIKSLNMVVFPWTDMLQKPLVKQAIPQDDDSALFSKSELISSTMAEFSEKTAITDSASQESGIPLDLNASKETLPINFPVKDETLVKEEKSELISSNVVGCNEKTAITDFSSQELGVHLDDDCSLDANKDILPINSSSKDESCCEPELQLPEKEPYSSDSHSDSKVDEIAMQKGDETPGEEAVKVDDHCSLDASKDTLPLNFPAKDESPCELPGKESDSIHSLSDVKVKKTAVQSGNGSSPLNHAISSDVASESHVQVPDKESDSIHSHSDFKADEIAVQNGNGSNLFVCSLDSSKDTLLNKSPIKDESPRESELPLPGMESDSIHSSSDSKVEETANGSNSIPTQVHDLPHGAIPSESHVQVQLPEKGSDSIHSHSNSKVEEIAMQNGNGTSGKEAVKDNIRFSEEKQGSHESEINTKENGSKAGNNFSGVHSDVSFEYIENPCTERV